MPFDPTAPKAARAVYLTAFNKHKHRGQAEAHKRGVRAVQISGWFKTNKGWQQLHPDLSEKVEVREAILQPDGTYVIQDVPVFYPNSVKGKKLPFDADENRRMIRNTNASIATGAQKPGIIEGHPHPDAAMIGTQLDANGFGVNWREYKKPGWAMCDLIDVKPHMVLRLQDHKLTGLSAGLAMDAGGLNKRFGHVAMLGGTAQALSSLPSIDVYSSSALYFSAEQPRITMSKMSPGCKAKMAAFQAATAAYEAAEASEMTGEPGFESKMADAYQSVTAAYAAMNDEMMGNPGNNPVVSEGGPPADQMGPEGTGAVSEAMGPATGVTEMPEEGEYSEPTVDFVSEPEEYLRQLNDNARKSDARSRKLAAIVNLQQVKLRDADNRQRFAIFSAQVETLRREGRPLPAKEAVKADYDLLYQSANPEQALTSRLAFYRSIPAAQTPATVNRRQPVVDRTEAVKPYKAADPSAHQYSTQELEDIVPDADPEKLAFAAIGADCPTF